LVAVDRKASPPKASKGICPPGLRCLLFTNSSNRRSPGSFPAPPTRMPIGNNRAVTQTCLLVPAMHPSVRPQEDASDSVHGMVMAPGRDLQITARSIVGIGCLLQSCRVIWLALGLYGTCLFWSVNRINLAAQQIGVTIDQQLRSGERASQSTLSDVAQ